MSWNGIVKPGFERTRNGCVVVLENRPKAVLNEMKFQRFEIPVDPEKIERAVAVILDEFPHPIVALFVSPNGASSRDPEGIKKLLNEGRFHRPSHHADGSHRAYGLTRSHDWNR